MIRLSRVAAARALCVLGLVLVPFSACTKKEQVSAAATKPLSPAEGAKDYDVNPGGPFEKPIIPSPSGEPSAGPTEVADCPPTCGANGAWIGCGLKKARGSKCEGCTPKCKAKGTPDEGWYDCAGVLIVQRACGG